MATKGKSAVTEPPAQEPEVDESSAATVSKHADQIGTVDVKNDNPPDPKEIPDEDAGFEDPDDLELAEAKKAVEDEQGGTEPGEEGADEPPAPSQQPPAQEPPDTAVPPQQEPPAQGGDQMVPIARLNEEIRKREDLERAANYYKGQADARAGLAQPPSDPGQQQPSQQQPRTPEEQISALRSERREAFNKYEAGEISGDDYNEIAEKVEDGIWQVRDAAKAPVQQQQPKQGEDLYLKEKSDEIEAKHPYLQTISDYDLYYLTRKGRAELGFGDRTLNNAEILSLRQHVAELTDLYGPAMTGVEAGAQPAASQQQPGQASQVAAQRHAKLAQAAGAPPDVSTIGQGAQPTTGYTPAQIEAMGDEELISKVPESTRRAMLEGVR